MKYFFNILNVKKMIPSHLSIRVYPSLLIPVITSYQTK